MGIYHNPCQIRNGQSTGYIRQIHTYIQQTCPLVFILMIWSWFFVKKIEDWLMPLINMWSAETLIIHDCTWTDCVMKTLSQQLMTLHFLCVPRLAWLLKHGTRIEKEWISGYWSTWSMQLKPPAIVAVVTWLNFAAGNSLLRLFQFIAVATCQK